MLTYEDCLGMSELTEEEIDAIAEHEHCDSIIALEMGNYLMHAPDGSPRIRRMILDDIAAARQRGDFAHAAKLKRVMEHFCQIHPEANDVD
ncbi:hypothetical protein J2T57_003464 [Natronocella acetinitrilica]|jgi:hypothetical protein|uniref:Uncharacterized protein n=1 Tax=Natronocella acetinitrilica TaxID=414046 RepID=A0AAE3G5S3_9GAMM|nr:hypothetical protein [Natronocella acetinitrilica]MCP1676305.1 hypothetical protein [Natronocella acetinitrilica]